MLADIPQRRREREGGSVLVMVVGVLVIMMLMATAFLASVTMQRNAARNYKMKGMAEMACWAARYDSTQTTYTQLAAYDKKWRRNGQTGYDGTDVYFVEYKADTSGAPDEYYGKVRSLSTDPLIEIMKDSTELGP